MRRPAKGLIVLAAVLAVLVLLEMTGLVDLDANLIRLPSSSHLEIFQILLIAAGGILLGYAYVRGVLWAAGPLYGGPAKDGAVEAQPGDHLTSPPNATTDRRISRVKVWSGTPTKD